MGVCVGVVDVLDKVGVLVGVDVLVEVIVVVGVGEDVIVGVNPGHTVDVGVILGVIEGVKLIVGVMDAVGVLVGRNAITIKYQFLTTCTIRYECERCNICIRNSRSDCSRYDTIFY